MYVNVLVLSLMLKFIMYINICQIENEYGNVESEYGSGGKAYMEWAAQMAFGLGAGVPWIMCKQTDAPEYIVDTRSLAINLSF